MNKTNFLHIHANLYIYFDTLESGMHVLHPLLFLSNL